MATQSYALYHQSAYAIDREHAHGPLYSALIANPKFSILFEDKDCPDEDHHGHQHGEHDDRLCDICTVAKAETTTAPPLIKGVFQQFSRSLKVSPLLKQSFSQRRQGHASPPRGPPLRTQ